MTSRWWVPWLGWGVLVGGWELGCRFSGIPAFLLPSPSAVGAAFGHHFLLLLKHGVVTAGEVVGGMCLAVVVALPLAVGCFSSPALEKMLTPILVASQAMPIFALAPLLVVWCGYGVLGKVVMAAIVIFFPVMVALHGGFRGCDRDYERLFMSLGSSFWKTFRLLHWPWALPALFTGLRTGAAVATIGAVLGEWVGARQGLGYLMIQANARLQTDLLFAALGMLTLLGLGLWKVVGEMERRVLVWRGR